MRNTEQTELCSVIKKKKMELCSGLLKTAVRPAWLYGNKCWGKKTQHGDEVAKMHMLRWMCRVTYIEMVMGTEAEIRG